MPSSRNNLSDWMVLAVIILIGAVLIAGLSALFNGNFFGGTAQAIVCLIGVIIAVMASMFGVTWLAKRMGWRNDGVGIFAWLFALFVGAPAILWFEAWAMYQVFGRPTLGR